MKTTTYPLTLAGVTLVEQRRKAILAGRDALADAKRFAASPDPSWRRLDPGDHWYQDAAGLLYWREGAPSQHSEPAPWE